LFNNKLLLNGPIITDVEKEMEKHLFHHQTHRYQKGRRTLLLMTMVFDNGPSGAIFLEIQSQ